MSNKIIYSKNIDHGTFLDYFLPLIYIFSFYDLKISSLGMLIMYFYTAYKFVFFQKKKVYIPKWLFIFMLYLLSTQFIIFFCYGGIDNSRIFNIISAILMIFIIAVNMNSLNKRVFLKNYIIIAFIASVFIIIQSVQINVMHQNVKQIMLLPFEINSEWYSVGIRPMSFFPEPQAYATFILPLIIILMEEKKKFLVILFSFAIVISTSSLGILSVLIIFIYYLLSSNMNIKQKIMILFFIMIGIFITLNLPAFKFAIDKILNTDFINNVRLTRGLTVFSKLEFLQKMFGIGYNNLGYFLQQAFIILNDDLSHVMKNPAYVTSVYEILIYFGVCGFYFYLLMFISFLKQKKYRILIILLLILSFAQTIFFNASWIFYMLIYLNYSNLKEKSFIGFRIN